MKKVLVVVLALAMIFALAACGDGGSSSGGAASSDPNVGVYTGTTVEMMGISMDMSEIYEGDSILELKDGGKGSMTLDGETIGIDWTVDGSDITISIEGQDSTGTIGDGTVTIDLLDMGMEMTFVK